MARKPPLHAPDAALTARPMSRSYRDWGFILALIVIVVAAAAPASGQPSPVDTTGLAAGEHGRMRMLLEKTIFQVDVLTLEIRLGPGAAAQLDSLVDGREFSKDLADSAAGIALEAQDVWAQIEFRRGVSLDQFLDGVRDNLRRAEAAGIVTAEDYSSIAANLPTWYAFLADRRIQTGDRMFYRIRGDTLRTVFQSGGGEILLDQVDVGPERRLSVLGGYFAPDSDFRDKLVRSLLRRDG